VTLDEIIKKLGWTGKHSGPFIQDIKCSCGGTVHCRGIMHTTADIAFCDKCSKEIRLLADGWTITRNGESGARK